MRRPALANGHMRSASCPPAISNEVGTLSQFQTSQPEPPSSSGESATSLADSATAPDESSSNLEELEEGEIPSTTNLAESPSNLEELEGEIPSTTNLAPVPDESPSNLEELEEGEIPSTTNLAESPSNLEELEGEIPSTTNLAPVPDESPSNLEELEEGEIPSTPPPTTNLAPPPPSPRPSIAPRPRNSRARVSVAPSPEPILGHSQHTPVQPNGGLDSKRKRASTDEGLADQPQSNNKKRNKRDYRVDRTNFKYSGELGHDFFGFICFVNDHRAWDIADGILQLPIPQSVSKRLVYFCDASIRCLCGAAGIVWPRSLAFNEWEGKGVFYPLSTHDSGTVELFAIACTLELAISQIDGERTTAEERLRGDNDVLQRNLSLTKSHLHGMTKEVFVFTDDINALRRIGGSVAYDPKGDMASHLEAIARHSGTLSKLGVHVELHLSPGHSNVPGNEAADKMAKKAQNELFVQTAISWPAMEWSDQGQAPLDLPSPL
ncbi:hypothetical protein N7516_001785 [Penicillium verrucosum]|uniref:uncharacterized protein n=1 Tax=Penicillium verrucosum TaxID=60171 RepID=UPI0025455AA9|nr:uncharacterized protein N7516_001785 [Penicillium verrucosum]KAJ5941617.1 hypothetical protein N7516_001785 [Penicillium verrucosum]